MKSLDDLKKIREAAQHKVIMRGGTLDSIKILVGMGTCGINAGARPIMTKFVEELAKRNLITVTVAPIDCTGNCDNTPIVKVVIDKKETTYGNVTEKMIAKIIKEHVEGGKPVQDYVLGNKK